MRTIIVLSLFLFSCSSLEKAVRIDNQVILTRENLYKLDGEHEIFANDTATVSLDLALTFKKYWWGDFAEKKSYKLSIRILDENHLQANIFKNDSLVSTSIVKFKVEDGSLVIKRNKASPFYFIFNNFGSMTTRLTLLDNGNLSVDHDNFQVATLLIIPLTGDHVNCNGLEFQRRPASFK